MGGCKRPAALVLITIGADLVAAALAGLPARVEVALVGVLRDVYPEYVIDQDDRRAGFAVDSINVVAKRAGLSVNYRAFATWSDTRRRSSAPRSISFPSSPLPRRTNGTRPVLTSLLSIIRPAG